MSVPQYRIRCSEVLKKALLAAGADRVREALEERFLSEEERLSRQVEVPAAIVEAVRRFGAEAAMEMMFPVKTASYAVVDGVVTPPVPDSNDPAWGLEAKEEDFGAFSERIVAPVNAADGNQAVKTIIDDLTENGILPFPSVEALTSEPKHPLEDEVTESGAPSWPGPYGGEADVSDGTATTPVAPRNSVVRPAVKVFSRTAEERAEKLKLLGGILGVGNEENQEP